MNFFQVLSLTLKRKLAQMAISQARTSLLKALPARHPTTGRPYSWSSSTPIMLLDGVVLFGGLEQSKVSRIILESWYQQQKRLCKQVAETLRVVGYRVAITPSTKPVASARVEALRAVDITERDNKKFFYPAGQPMAGEASDEEVTLMAALLGWSAYSLDVSQAQEPAPGEESKDKNITVQESTMNSMEDGADAGMEQAKANETSPSASDGNAVDEYLHEQPGEDATVAASLDELAQAASVLADRIDQYTYQLRAGELPADFEPAVMELAKLQQSYKMIAIGLLDAAAPLLTSGILPSPPATASVAYLQLVHAEWVANQQLALHTQTRQQAALATLEQVGRIRLQTSAAFKPLAEVHANAAALMAEIEATAPFEEHPAIAELVAGSHPLALLLRLAADPDAAKAEEEESEVAQALGDALPGALVLALFRGRLFVNTDADLAPIVLAPETEVAPVVVTASNSPEAEPTLSLPMYDATNAVEMQEPCASETAVAPLLDITLPATHPPQKASLQEEAIIETAVRKKVEEEVAASPSVPIEANLPVISEQAAAVTEWEWLAEAQWELLDQQRFALAWQLTAAADPPVLLASSATPLLAKWELQCLALAQEIGPATTGMQVAYTAALGEGFENSFAGEWACQAVRVAGALRPALLAPSSQAAMLLQNGLAGVPDFNQLSQLVGQRDSMEPLQPALLQQYQSEQQWEQEGAQLHAELRQWRTASQHAEFRHRKHHPMTAFWRHNWHASQPIGKLVGALEQAGPDASRMSLVRKILADLEDDVQLERGLREASLQLEPNRQAWPWFKLHVSPLLRLGQRWLMHQQQRPLAGRLHYQGSQDQLFCQKLGQLLPLAHAELAEHRRRETSNNMLVALDLLIQALRQLDNLLKEGAPSKMVEPTLSQFAVLPLLRTSALPLLPTGAIAGSSADKLTALREIAAEPELAWAEAYQMQLKAGNFLACALLRGWPPALKGIGGLADLPRTSYQAELRQHEPRLRHALKQAEQALEAGVRKGYVGEQLRTEGVILLAKLNDQLTSKPRPEDAPLSFPYLHQQINELRQAIETIRQQSVMQVQNELTKLLEQVPDFRKQATQDRIEQVLRESSISVAYHYVAQLTANEDITKANVEASELQVFLDRLPPLESSALAQLPEDHINSLLKGGKIGGQDLGKADLKTRELASEAITDWEQLRAKRQLKDGANYQSIIRLCTFLGLRRPVLTAVSLTMQAGYEVVDIEQMYVSGKDECPIASFASEAKGAYRLLLARTRVSDVDELFNQAEAASETGLVSRPMLVFYFHPLTLSQRYDLAGLSREKKRTFLVLDSLLLLYLASAGLQRARLPLFFQLTLPFTYVKPYITGGSTLPPEMFYGREAEKRQLLSSSSDSSCLVYGGRQLGKTAILRDIQRTYHQPEKGHLVLFLDIRQLGFEGHPIDNIVRELSKLLQQFEVGQLSKAMSSGKMKIARLLDYVRQWLEENEQNRLLLFLDEADQFLNQDAAKQFEYTNAFKSLMDDTDRRFKVVFSGTHNVQRTYRLPNQPLSQLGTAVCIGPLIARNEVRQAEALVRRPLESLGFEFEKEELVTEILVETNYFPSLIQVFCDRLLTHLYATYSSEAGQRPHHLINEYDISTASHKARADIRAKFLLTLDLNNRFKLLAYLLASQDVIEMYGDSAQDGLTAAQLHAAARDYWPAAFGPHSSDAEFQVLLDEIVEMSVATYLPALSTYYLRTPNLRQLLGTPADVERELQDFVRMPVPDAYQADLDRDIYGGQSNPVRLPGPFTAAQYAILRTNGATIVRGTEAAGLMRVEDFLRSQPDINCEVLGFENDLTKCQQDLETIKDNRPAYKTTIVLVCRRYGLELVKFAADLTRGLSSETKPMHVVFLMDPPKLMKVLRGQREALERLRDARVSLIELHPWQPRTLSQWMKEQAEVPTYSAKVQELTGGWHDPLFYFLECLTRQPDHAPAAALAALEQYVHENSPASKWGLIAGTPEEEVMRLLVSLGEPFTQAQIEEWLPEMPAQTIALSLAWAEILGLVVAAPLQGAVQAQQYLSQIIQ